MLETVFQSAGRILIFAGIVMTLYLMALPTVSAFADSPKPAVANVGGTVKGKEARIHFYLENVFFPEMIEALESGIEISFRIGVEVDRIHRNWFNVTIGDIQYTQSIRYDVLARVYRLRHPDGDEILPDLQQALERMTFFQVTVPLNMEVTSGKLYRASVRVRLDRTGLSELFRSIVFFSSMWEMETNRARGPVTAP